jgi:magnesium transporter
VLSTYNSETRSLERGEAPTHGMWLDVVDPSEVERRSLREVGVPEELLKDALDTDELSRVDHHVSGARLFVLRVPASATADTAVVPLGVVTLPTGQVVTISAFDTGLPASLIAHGDMDPNVPDRFSLLLAERVAARFVATLQAIDRDIVRLETKLRVSLENDEIMLLLEHQKRLVFLDFALDANQIVLERALEDTRLGLGPEDRILLEDVIVEIRQAVTMTRTRKELLGETMDALATVVSNNLNVAMKKIASLTLLATVPAVFAGIYGMNVTLPFATAPYAFAGILALAIGTTTALATYLRAQKWL